MDSGLNFLGATEVSKCLKCYECNQDIRDVVWYKCTCSDGFQFCELCVNSRGFTSGGPFLHRTTCQRPPLTKVLYSEYITSVPYWPAWLYNSVIREDSPIDTDSGIYNIAGYMMNNNVAEIDQETFGKKLLEYFTNQNSAINHHIKMLSLDGGGIRGYIEIRVLQWLIKEFIADVNGTEINHDDLMPLSAHINTEIKKVALEAQRKFSNYFDYISGTSTGGLIAFCLVMDVPLLEILEIYGKFKDYFKVNRVIPFLSDENPIHRLACKLSNYIATSTYDSSIIHSKIDDIILDVEIRNNMRRGTETEYNLRRETDGTWYGPFLNEDTISRKDYIVKYPPKMTFGDINKLNKDNLVEQGCDTWPKKCLVLTAFDCTANKSVIWSSNNYNHFEVPVADALKSTMAAPTFFPPHIWTPKYFPGDRRVITVDDLVKRDWFFSRWGKKIYYTFKQPQNVGECDFVPHAYIDGGIFANDPELCALLVAREDHSRQKPCILVGIGTTRYTKEVIPLNYSKTGWILPGGLLVTTLMDANTSFIEQAAANMTTFSNIRRCKLNYTLDRNADLADPTFVAYLDNVFHEHTRDPKIPTPEVYLANGVDMQSLLKFCIFNKNEIVRTVVNNESQ